MASMVQTTGELVSEMARMQRSLPSRPSLDQVDAALEIIARVDAALAQRLEAVILQPRPASVAQPVFRAYQEMVEDALRCEAQAEKRMASAVLELEERHRRFDALLLKVYALVSAADSSSINGVGPVGVNGSSKPVDVGAALDQKIQQRLGNAPGEGKSGLENASADHVALDLAVPLPRAHDVNGKLSDEVLKLGSPPANVTSDGNSLASLPEFQGRPKDKQSEAVFHPSLAAPLSASLSLSNSGFEPLTTIHEDGAAGTCPPKLLVILEDAVEKGSKGLNLRDTELTWLPDSVGLLSNLTELNLSKNHLEKLPESIGDLKQLTILDASANKLKELPESLGRLTNLRKLNIMKNAIEELPYTIGGCYSLEELRVDFNHLKALPEAVGNLVSLRILSAHLNTLTRLPTTMSSLTNLTELDVHFNHLECLPESVCTLTNLTKLDVSSNFHELKALPESIGNLQRLQELDISFNHLTVLPDSFAVLTGLRELRLDGNPFQIPPLEVAEKGKKAVLDYMQRHVAMKQGKPSSAGLVSKFTRFVLGLLRRSRKTRVQEIAVTS